MGQYGQLGYGVIFDDGAEFPWDAEPFDGDIKEWWRVEQGFDRSKDFPAEGWIENRKEFDGIHPCPAEVVNYCSGNYPMYMLAIPSTCRSASRGYPERLESWPELTDAEKNALTEFCAKYELTPEGEAGWYLTSYWG